MELPGFKDVAKHFLDKSLYSLGLSSQLALSPSSSIMLSTEGHGERKGRRHKMMLFQKARIAAIFLYIFLIFYKKSYRTPSFVLQINFSRLYFLFCRLLGWLHVFSFFLARFYVPLPCNWSIFLLKQVSLIRDRYIDYRSFRVCGVVDMLWSLYIHML